MISLICAMGKNREIGKNNHLLWNLPKDMKFFQKTTKGKKIVMGRKTLESIGRALPDRTNIVLTQNQQYSFPKVQCMHNIEPLIQSKEDIMVIGGSMIYETFLPFADTLILTTVESEFPEADSFFPFVDFSDFTLQNERFEPADHENPFDMNFRIWTRT